MASPLMLFMYALVGPFAILRLYARNLMRQAYKNSILLKLAASIVSLAVASQIAYEYRSRNTLRSVIYGLLAFLLNYWYLIPVLLIYLVPVIQNLLKLWLTMLNGVTAGIIRPGSTKLRQMLPSIWTFESNRKLWPIESVCFMLAYGAIGPALYCGYEVYSHLYFGISFNLCIAIGTTILVTTTLWNVLEAIDRDLHPFLFAAIVQYYIIPIKSLWNVPLTILVTTFLFPLLNKLLTSDSIRDLIQNLRLLHFRTFVEANANYKQFFSELINILISLYLPGRVLIVCLTSEISWLVTVSIMSFLPVYLYLRLIRLIKIEPNTLVFLSSSFVLSQYILSRRMENHFIYKYFLLIMILTLYFALVYPLVYHILRHATIHSSHQRGEQLKSTRESIHRTVSLIANRYLRFAYVHEPSKRFILHLSNVLIAVSFAMVLPVNLLVRLVVALLSYLLMGRLLMRRGLEILGTLLSLGTSIAAGAHVYTRYDRSLLLTMSITLITYVSTTIVAFPLVILCLQSLFVYFPWSNVLDQCLARLFAYAWSHLAVFWPHIKASCYQVKRQIEQSRINIFSRPTPVQ